MLKVRKGMWILRYWTAGCMLKIQHARTNFVYCRGGLKEQGKVSFAFLTGLPLQFMEGATNLMEQPTELKKLAYISVLIAFGIVLNLFEPSFFSVIPGVRIGLANIVSVLALLLFGEGACILTALLRSTIGSLIKGALNPIPLGTSVIGATSAAIVMALIYKLFKRHFSVIGISIIGGIINNFAQFLVVILITRNKAFFYYLPVLLFLGGVSGWIIGILSQLLYNKLKKVNISNET